MTLRRNSGKALPQLLAAVFAVAALLIAIGVFFGGLTLHELFTENKRLKQAIKNITREDKIGYAKVMRQELKDGKCLTTMKFVETARDNPLKKVLERKYVIVGDVVHFDALIIKFGDQMVMDGKERSLYIWRRVYGENTAPEKGYAIEEPGKEAARYKDVFGKLGPKEREMFWTEIWDLANNPDKLQQYGIKAIYGNAVYSKLKVGLIYVFRISHTGQVYPEAIPEM